ncbi:hypothetical protein DICVIV_10450, partial [Dictyocaulus viviparus]
MFIKFRMPSKELIVKEEEIKLSVHFGLDNLEEDELRINQRFRTHVGKFQRFFTGILEMLSKGPDEAENIVQVLRIVGRQHGNVRSMSFTAEKWLIFKNVLLSLLCRDNTVSYSATVSRYGNFVVKSNTNSINCSHTNKDVALGTFF